MDQEAYCTYCGNLPDAADSSSLSDNVAITPTEKLWCDRSAGL